LKNSPCLLWIRACTLALAVAFAALAHADLNVPSGSTIDLAGGDLDLACTDLTVAGTLALGSGRVLNARNVSIAAGGLIQAGSGSITLAGNWSNAGDFQAGTSRVTFTDIAGCSTTSTVTGNTTFYVLALISNSGRVINFAPGSAQNVLQQIIIAGSAASPIILQSSSSTNLASINLTGSQSISNVGVNNVQAIGQWLAIGQSNALVSGLAPRWFGEGPQVPTLPPFALLVMTLLFAFLARRRLGNGPRKDSSL
jgi:hypothetical protein